jgi:hypothetical protein
LLAFGLPAPGQDLVDPLGLQTRDDVGEPSLRVGVVDFAVWINV